MGPGVTLMTGLCPVEKMRTFMSKLLGVTSTVAGVVVTEEPGTLGDQDPLIQPGEEVLEDHLILPLREVGGEGCNGAGYSVSIKEL